jgi:hypothetical protein
MFFETLLQLWHKLFVENFIRFLDFISYIEIENLLLKVQRNLMRKDLPGKLLHVQICGKCILI